MNQTGLHFTHTYMFKMGGMTAFLSYTIQGFVGWLDDEVA
jgi:hypothetical protein